MLGKEIQFENEILYKLVMGDNGPVRICFFVFFFAEIISNYFFSPENKVSEWLENVLKMLCEQAMALVDFFRENVLTFEFIMCQDKVD